MTADAHRALREARALAPHARLLALRVAGEALAEALRGGPSVQARTLRLDRIVLERGVAMPLLRAPFSFLMLERRAVSIGTRDGVVLIDPATPDAFVRTPFGQRFFERHRIRGRLLEKQARAFDGAGMGEVRRVALTTLRYQSLRSLLERFPRAEIFVHPDEHARYLDPPPSERAGYERDAVPHHERLILKAEGELTPGVSWVETPGLSSASMSIAFHQAGAIRVVSPHGVALDCWSPYESRLPGFREALRLRDIEAVPRGDADPVEASISMGLERVIADRREDAPAFFDIVPSLELVPSVLAPLAPTTAAR